ncbi:MAG: MBL fold metallo-hydrolase [Kiritimatiellae bacterium]|nr:MBL fold metallo-hydrolase [Kiritimatiellia bacterium]
MALRFCVLGSSSAGNATWVASETTAILVDAGFSLRTIEERLAAIGQSAASLRAVVVSHEHSDHIAGIPRLQRRHGVEVFANEGTREGALQAPEFAEVRWTLFQTGHAFQVGDLTITPFAVPHDAYDPVGFLISHDGTTIGIATDLGTGTTLVSTRLQACRALVLEANHDERMLRDSRRPWPLKQRILSRQGHLSNRAAAALLLEAAGPTLTDVFLAHLSQECNQPDFALQTIEEELRRAGYHHIRLRPTYPDRPAELWPGV